MLVEFTDLFNKQRKEASLDIKIAFRETLETFLENPYHPSLRNHVLTQEYAGIRSIDVTDNVRALYREVSEHIIFVELGTHEELYG